jgi:hypothetical protein
MRPRTNLLGAIALLLALAQPGACADDGAARAEIDALLVRLKTSGCDFNRNGSWYDAGRAESHLRDKYGYYVKHTRAVDAEEFIATMASASSTSGKAYRVRCAGGPERDSGDWFREALAELRKDPR